MKKVLLLTMGMFTLGFDAYVIAGLLPDIRATFHMSDAQTGQAVTVFTLCYALAAPFFATLLAGKPLRTILVLALAVFTLGNGITALAWDIPSFFISRAVAGVGAGLFSPLAASAAVSLVVKEKSGRALGLTLGGMSIGTVAGVPLGLMIADFAGWQGTLWVITALGFSAMIGIASWMPRFPATAPPPLRERLAMITHRQVAMVVGITFIASTASLGLYTYITTILEQFANIHSHTPYIWAWGIGGVVGSLSIGTLIDRTGRPKVLMLWLLSILALSMFSLSFATNAPFFAFVPIFLWGAMGWASLAPQQQALLAIQPEHGPTTIALNSSANYLGSSVGSMLGGAALFAGLSPTYLPIAAGMLILLAVLGQWMIVGKQRDFRMDQTVD
ncbi:MFS transporter [Bacillaceae bacterium SIJ1]|uniref:MFS transporter n=1 Tax=Litoribacterium kuwaitense TaxID=1398745 RepID=UPI0013E9F95D|nr:MFS transporter [Litoribacterium kuwaitense]NGP46209.1 MFS transporter [Litoribacterium kuwaitense]